MEVLAECNAGAVFAQTFGDEQMQRCVGICAVGMQ